MIRVRERRSQGITCLSHERELPASHSTHDKQRLGPGRDHVTHQRRAFVRVFACEQDLSHELPDAPLPDAVATGAEPFLIVGAMAGG